MIRPLTSRTARMAAVILALGVCGVFHLRAQPFPGGGFGGGGFGGGGAFGGNRSRTQTQYPANGDVGDAVISIDPETRSLVVIADERTRAYISQVVSNLDRPKPQVLIKVVFVEVERANAADLGIEGGFGRQNMAGTVTAGNAANVFGLGALLATNTANNALGQPLSAFQAVAPITSPGAGLYQILGQDYQVTLRAIAQAGKAKVLSRPSIVARNNQPATITVGQSVPLVNGVRYDNYGNVINSIAYTSVGIILRVTPFITSDGMVEMIVSPETSSLVADQSQWVPISATAKAPVINDRSADTVVVTPDGQTVIIGGLMATQKSESDLKIPLLGDIPLLGALFKRKVTSDQQTELLIFLTPRIIEAPTQMAALAAVEREKYNIKKDVSEQELNRLLDGLPVRPPDSTLVPSAPMAPPKKGKPMPHTAPRTDPRFNDLNLGNEAAPAPGQPADAPVNPR